METLDSMATARLPVHRSRLPTGRRWIARETSSSPTALTIGSERSALESSLQSLAWVSWTSVSIHETKTPILHTLAPGDASGGGTIWLPNRTQALRQQRARRHALPAS